MDYKTEMRELRDTLNAHGYRYYVLDAPPSATMSTTICSAAWRTWSGSTRRR